MIQKFNSVFDTTDNPRVFFAPGRINLIGEHTDYNGGHVFPAAISYGTYAIARKRTDHKLNFYSINFPDKGILTCSLTDVTYNKIHDWANFPKGMVKLLQDNGHTISTGMDILFYGNIPNGAGLSSSASIEMVMGVLLENLFDLTIDKIDMIKLAQLVENQYMGVNSGIMDQFAVGMAKKNNAMLLNCNTLQYEYAPLALQEYVIIITNTNKRRELADSKYNERRSECERALTDLQQTIQIDNLCDLSIEAFEANKHVILNDTDRLRAKHVIYENHRTIRALELLKQNRLPEFGQAMNESHVSLQYDYEVTGIELDTIVETAWKQEGVIGARMTGAGFGGCTIAIVAKDHVDIFKRNISETYRKKIGYDVTHYTAAIGDGAKEITIKGVV
ncbi:galactokinase [Virgibacillus flavescens]|uniref:galactokinase n=1 Tax=Virgibacillus flavescens TaxID=1611422 RepID=UPI003D343878